MPSRRWLFALASIVAVLAAAPAAAEWRQNATTATWYFRAPSGSPRCQTASEVPRAIAALAEDARSAWRGLVVASASIEFDAALAGECELRVTVPRSEGSTFVDTWAPWCGAVDGANLAERSAAVDRCIKADLQDLVRAHRVRTRPPVAEPEPLDNR